MTPLLLAASLVLRAATAIWPIVVWRRARDRRLIALSAIGALLLLEGAWRGADANIAVSLAISALAFAAVVVAGRVVANRLRTYRQIRVSERLHRLTLEAGSDAVFLTDDRGVLVHSWPSVARFFLVEREHVLPGRSCESLLGQLPKGLDALAEGAERTVEIAIEGDGHGRRILVTVKRVDILGATLLFSCRDVTEVRGVESALDQALEEVRSLKDRFQAEALYLQEEIRGEHDVQGIIGTSPGLQETLRAIDVVAGTHATVLIRGETGTGKELVARAIHDLSDRSSRPLVKVNCAALPATLVESELFGHEKGAFTGASERKKGRFELAHEGTLFLDEIGELPLELQPKLLRVLQEGEMERVGGTETIQVDVRLLAATNRDLEAEVEAGRFRSDLFYRLAVFLVDVPPLRDRSEDIPLLARHFLEEFGHVLGRSFDGFTRGSMEAMARYPWPGNIRELRNVVERAALTSQGPVVDIAAHLAREDGGPRPTSGGSRRLEDVERRHIEAVLTDVGWTVEGPDGAAVVLDMNPSTLRARMKKLGIRRPR